MFINYENVTNFQRSVVDPQKCWNKALYKVEFDVPSSLGFEDLLHSQFRSDLRPFRICSLLGEPVVSHEPLVSGIVGEGLGADDEEHPPADAPSGGFSGTWGRYYKM